MQIATERKSKITSMVYIFLLWGAYVALYMGLKTHEVAARSYGEYFFTSMMILSECIITIYFFCLWRKVTPEIKKFFGFLFLAFVLVLINDIIYRTTFYFLHLTQAELSTLWLSSYNLPYLGFLIFSLMGFVYVLFRKELLKPRSNIFIFVPIFVVISALFFMFFYSYHWKSASFSIRLFYDISEPIFQLLVFVAALLCLALAKNRNLFYIALSYLIFMSIDFVMELNLFQQSFGASSFLETFWMLGYFLIIYSLYNIKKKAYTKISSAWIEEPNSLKVQFVFWAFLLINFALVVFFITAYSFFPKEALVGDKALLESFFPVFAVFSVVTVIASGLFADKLCRPLQRLGNLVNLFMKGDARATSLGIKKVEQNILEFRRHEEFLLKAFSVLRSKLDAEKRLNKLAIQVAHDIRSPLTALQMLSSQARNLDEENRTMIRNAATRINDIANHLLVTYHGIIGGDKEQITSELMASIVDNILSEKRIQYVNRNIQFELMVQPDAQGVFVNVNVERCKRVLSNLIDNAIESIRESEPGTVTLNLDRRGNLLILEIIDNGYGMSEELLKKIGVEKFTFDKKGGSGVGLFTAVQQIRNWGGGYEVQSEINKGTTFTIKLPITHTPKWFQSLIEIIPPVEIVILDDDETIHNIWDMRFKGYQSITLLHFYAQNELENYYKQTDKEKKHLYLIDQELLNSAKTGLEIIKELNIVKDATLVTSYYEDQGIRKECLQLNLRIIPKNFSPYIPIEFLGSKENMRKQQELEQPDFIFIDDDYDLVQAWKMYAASKQVKLATFGRAQDFEKVKHKYRKDIPIYIDYSLPGIDGVTYAKQLFKEGFTTIYLATGYDKEYFEESMPWFKDIVSKGFPFAG